MDWIITANIPFSSVEHPSFRNTLLLFNALSGDGNLSLPRYRLQMCWTSRRDQGTLPQLTRTRQYASIPASGAVAGYILSMICSSQTPYW